MAFISAILKLFELKQTLKKNIFFFCSNAMKLHFMKYATSKKWKITVSADIINCRSEPWITKKILRIATYIQNMNILKISHHNKTS